ncbi:RING finger protein 37 [Coemansia sp. RSA 1286]|nr:RING finger protein 37 [Coemansia sp. RSA 1286]
MSHSNQTSNRLDLFDYADHRIGTTVTCDYPSATNHDIQTLLNKQPFADNSSLPISLGTTQPSGFLAESFVKPPLEITFTFAHPISLAAITINPRARQHSAKSILAYIWNQRHQKWTPIGRIFWDQQMMGSVQALCNRELNPQAVARAAAARKSQISINQGVARWLPIEPTRAMHSVEKVKIKITSMYHAHTLGLGAIEIWAQPSQLVSVDRRTAAWNHIRSTLDPPVSATDQLSLSSPVASNLTYKSSEEAPADFIDVITQTLMTDPVILPSGARCDRSTVVRHMSTSKTDPFTGLPMSMDQVKPDLSLQLRIKAWNERH